MIACIVLAITFEGFWATLNAILLAHCSSVHFV
jgi:hypothetical protein